MAALSRPEKVFTKEKAMDSKKYKLFISSYIENLSPEGLCEGDPERTETKAECDYTFHEGGAEILYTDEQNGEAASHRIVFTRPERVTVAHSGAVTTEMAFKIGELTKTLYAVGPYSFDMELMAKRIRCELGPEGGKLDLIYSMTIGGQKKNVRMKIEVS